MRVGSALIAFLIFSPATAAEINIEGPFSKAGFFNIYLSGELNLEDAKKFELQTKNIEKGVLFLASPGGSVLAGLAIGEYVRQKSFVTAVNSTHFCVSICPLIWLAGNPRYLYPSSKIGFHAAYYNEDGQGLVPSALANAWIGAYLDKLGYDYRFISVVVSAKPDEMLWLTPAELSRLGVSFVRADQLK